MGSMGKRRGRRTRSDEPGGRRDLEDGPGFPVFRYDAFTPAGTWERIGALARGNRFRRSRGETLRGRPALYWTLIAVVAVILLGMALEAVLAVVGLLT